MMPTAASTDTDIISTRGGTRTNDDRFLRWGLTRSRPRRGESRSADQAARDQQQHGTAASFGEAIVVRPIDVTA